MDEETAAKHGALFKRVVDGEDGSRNDVFVVNIGSDADDAVRRDANPGNELHHRIRPIDVAVDGVLIGEHALRESLANDNYGLLTLTIESIEITAGDDGNSECGKESRRDGAQLRARILFAGGMNMAVRRELETGAKAAGIAPGNDNPESRFVHTGQRFNPANRFLIEINHLLRRFSVGHCRNVDSEDVAYVEAGLRRLQRQQRLNQSAGACQQHERRGNLRHGEDAQPAIRTAGNPHAAVGETDSLRGVSLSNGSVRITGSTNRRLRIFAVTQIAASFVLLAGASALVKTLLSLQSAQTGLDIRHVLAINVPAMSYGKTPQQVVDFYKESIRRIEALPGVNKTAFGIVVPWRDAGSFGPGLQFSADGHVHAPGEEDPRAQLRTISPGFFAALGVPIIAGRDFNALDGQSKEPVVIVSETLAQRMFPNQDAVNRHVYWTDPVMKFIPGISVAPHRIIGVAADIDDQHVVPGPIITIYNPFEEGPMFGGRLFIHTSANPYSLVTPVTRIIRDMSVEQPVERAATLEDVRAEVLTPDRLNTLVFGGFATVALAIALVGVAGVLAFSVSARTREFGVRLAIGAQPRQLMTSVIAEGTVMAAAGVVAGAACGYLLVRLARSSFEGVQMPGSLPVVVSVVVLLAAAVVASVLPAARAAQVDVTEALRSE